MPIRAGSAGPCCCSPCRGALERPPVLPRGRERVPAPQRRHEHPDRGGHRRGVSVLPRRTVIPGAFAAARIETDVYYEGVNFIVAFILLGRLLEARAKSRTSEAIRGCWGSGQRRPGCSGTKGPAGSDRGSGARRSRDRPARRDGAGGRDVVDGETRVDESMLTGEPMPVAKGPGDRTVGGTVNQTGSVTLVARAVGKDTVLAQIVRLVEEAQGQKAPVQALADRVAGVFVPIVIAVAIAAFVVWFVVGPPRRPSSPPSPSSPCWSSRALRARAGHAHRDPGGNGEGARHGVLIRGGQALETLHRVDTVVFDKTGTITEGRPSVTHIHGAKRSDGQAVAGRSCCASRPPSSFGPSTRSHGPWSPRPRRAASPFRRSSGSWPWKGGARAASWKSASRGDLGAPCPGTERGARRPDGRRRPPRGRRPVGGGRRRQ